MANQNREEVTRRAIVRAERARTIAVTEQKMPQFEVWGPALALFAYLLEYERISWERPNTFWMNNIH